MRVSIITICRNAESTIEQTIRSVIEQTYNDIEYIIIDGDSTDKTMEIVNKYLKYISVIVSEPDDGIYDAMNKGIKNATGDVVGILNADDWYEADAVESAVEAFYTNDTEIVHGDLNFVYADNTTQEAPKTDTLDKLWYAMVVQHPTTFVKNTVYEKYGVFDANYKVAGDYEFILRCYAQGAKFYYLKKVLTNFRLTGVSNTGNYLCGYETSLISLKYVKLAPNEDEIRTIIYGSFGIYRLLERIENASQEVIEMIQDDIPELKEGVIIWGTGVWGKCIYDLLIKQGINVEAWIDGRTDLSEQYGIKVCRVNELDKMNRPVIIAIKELDDEIIRKKQEFISQNRHCITVNELASKALKKYLVENR